MINVVVTLEMLMRDSNTTQLLTLAVSIINLFLYIISSLSFVVVCIILPKSLASTFPHSSIHSEIYTVKNYCACLWLDERCIFTVVRFQSLKCVS